MTDNLLSKCQNCDCFMYCDPLKKANKSLRPRKNCKIQENCQNTVKIVVRGKCLESDEPASGANEHTDSSSSSMKKLCCKLGQKKDSKNGNEGNLKQIITEDPKNAKEASKVVMNNTKTEPSDQKLPEDAIYEYFKQSNCRKPAHGGCNTNTIIIPREKCGDCNPSLEFRNDIKINTKILEDIMNELHKQRREIHDVKEILDLIVRALREHFLMTPFGKNKNGLHDPFDDFRKNK